MATSRQNGLKVEIAKGAIKPLSQSGALPKLPEVGTLLGTLAVPRLA